MLSYLILGAIVGFPLVLGLVWRVGAPHLFFALMAGELLARYFGHESDFINVSEQAGHIIEPIMVILPVILTGLFLRKTISTGKTVLHIIPLLVTGFIMAVFLLPIMPESIQEIVSANEIGEYILSFNAPIIGVVVVTQLVYLWIINRRQHRHAGEK